MTDSTSTSTPATGTTPTSRVTVRQLLIVLNNSYMVIGVVMLSLIPFILLFCYLPRHAGAVRNET